MSTSQNNILETSTDIKKKSTSKKEVLKNKNQVVSDDQKITIDKLNETLVECIKNMKQIKTDIKKINIQYNNEILKVSKNNNKKKRLGNKQTGFGKINILPNDLADLISVNHGTEMSRPEFTKNFYKTLISKNLIYEKDKRILRVDDQISKILNIPMSVNNSIDHKDKNGFNFYNVQKYIAKCFNKVNPPSQKTKK